jgi:Helix-turn-helix domain
MSNYVPANVAAKTLGLQPDTLRRWAKNQKIKAFKTPGGRWLYDLSSVGIPTQPVEIPPSPAHPRATPAPAESVTSQSRPSPPPPAREEPTAPRPRPSRSPTTTKTSRSPVPLAIAAVLPLMFGAVVFGLAMSRSSDKPAPPVQTTKAPAPTVKVAKSPLPSVSITRSPTPPAMVTGAAPSPSTSWAPSIKPREKPEAPK